MNIRGAVIALLACFLLVGECVAGSSLTLTGRYEHRTDPESLEMLGGLVCFYPSPNSAKLLPRPKSDRRLAWFCFRNDRQTKKFLGVPVQKIEAGCGFTGHATVRVIGYTVYLGEGDDFDTASLQSVSGKSRSKVLACK